MPANEQIIPYKTVPRWLVPVSAGAFLTAAVAVAVSGVPLLAYLLPADMAIKHATFVVLETFMRAIAVLFLAFCAYLTYELGRHERLVLSDDSISFPLVLSPDLLFRNKRQLDDIGNVLLGAMLLEDRKGTYEYDLEEAKDKKKLFIYFKSGGHVSLDLNKMTKESMEKIFQAVEAWCIDCNRIPPASLPDKKKSPKPVELEDLTPTRMWEDELQAHFSATNFVPLEKGKELQGGRYEVLMQLASGGLSAVYLAEMQDKSLVILKEAALPKSIDEKLRLKAKELFEREARLLRKLSHPKIARVLDNFIERGRDYLVLEFVAGESLRQVVRKGGPQSEKTTLQLAMEAAQILDYLHDQEPPVVHRDITPDNLILRDDGTLALIDFGAANDLVGTATGTLVGKQCYMAPEQFKGKACKQSDIYALGCTLYFLLTAEDPDALSRSYPRDLREDVSEELNNLVADCTHLDLALRVEGAAQLSDRVEALLPSTVLHLGEGRKS